MLRLSSNWTRPVKTMLMALMEVASVDIPGSNELMSGNRNAQRYICWLAGAFVPLVALLLPPLLPPQAETSRDTRQSSVGRSKPMNLFLCRMYHIPFIIHKLPSGTEY